MRNFKFFLVITLSCLIPAIFSFVQYHYHSMLSDNYYRLSETLTDQRADTYFNMSIDLSDRTDSLFYGAAYLLLGYVIIMLATNFRQNLMFQTVMYGVTMVITFFWGMLTLVISVISLDTALSNRSFSAYAVGTDSVPFYEELSELFVTQHFLYLVFGIVELLLCAFIMRLFFRQESVQRVFNRIKEFTKEISFAMAIVLLVVFVLVTEFVSRVKTITVKTQQDDSAKVELTKK